MRLKPILLAACLAPLPLAVSAETTHDHDHEEHRRHGAYVHGVATLNLAQEGREIRLELHGPAANFIGFEHAPASKADHAALDRAVAVLKDGEKLFRFDAAAGCRMEHVEIDSELLEDEEHGHGHEDEHAHEKHEEHQGEAHSDMEAEYHFECADPGRLTRLTVELFEAFGGMEQLQAQYVLGAKQGAAELTAAHHVVRF